MSKVLTEREDVVFSKLCACDNVLVLIHRNPDGDALGTGFALVSFLKENGTALITVQYRNSYFNTYSEKRDAFRYNNGWIIPRGHDYAFYGIIQPQTLYDYCENAYLEIKEKHLNDGTVYLVVKK